MYCGACECIRKVESYKHVFKVDVLECGDYGSMGAKSDAFLLPLKGKFRLLLWHFKEIQYFGWN